MRLRRVVVRGREIRGSMGISSSWICGAQGNTLIGRKRSRLRFVTSNGGRSRQTLSHKHLLLRRGKGKLLFSLYSIFGKRPSPPDPLSQFWERGSKFAKVFSLLVR